jgi:hydroxypyruvate isomerase
MNRRSFSKILASGAVGAVALGKAVPANAANAAGEAPYKLSVMLWTVFRHLPFEQRLEKVSEAGYKQVELVGEYHKWSDADFKRAIAKAKQLGIHFDVTAGLKTASATRASAKGCWPMCETNCPSCSG